MKLQTTEESITNMSEESIMAGNFSAEYEISRHLIYRKNSIMSGELEEMKDDVNAIQTSMKK